MKIGFIGLGKMGGRMVNKLVTEEHEVVVWNRSQNSINDLRLKIKDLRTAGSIEDLIGQLEKPRIVWVMVPHVAVEEVLTEVRKFVAEGDIVIDGGNSNYKDTERRFEDFEKAGIRFLGIGVSGGIIASERGYPMMVGGSRLAYKHIGPVLDSLSKPNGGHEYFGTGGAGHFVKMVHNGIEYGMMQSLGEGLEILEKSRYRFDLLKIAGLWQKGTIVSGFLVDRIKDALEEDKNLSRFAGPIAASGEAHWSVEAADEEEIDVPIIEGSVEFREESADDPEMQNSFTAKVINALRRQFGGHTVRKN